MWGGIYCYSKMRHAMLIIAYVVMLYHAGAMPCSVMTLYRGVTRLEYSLRLL